MCLFVYKRLFTWERILVLSNPTYTVMTQVHNCLEFDVTMVVSLSHTDPKIPILKNNCSALDGIVRNITLAGKTGFIEIMM
jgi:hypothetical protein